MFAHRSSGIALFMLFCANSGLMAQQAFDDLLKRIPPNANALLLVDAKQVQESAYGIKEKLADKRERDYLSGATKIPPNVDRVAIAAQFNHGSLRALWEVALMQSNKALTLQGLLKSQGGNIDQVANQDVLVTARNSYIVPFGNKIIGLMRPADRQVTSRWIRTAKNPTGTALTPYLMEAVPACSPETPVIMAVDLADVFDVEGVYERLKHARFPANTDVDLKQLATVISGIKGFTLKVAVTDALTGELRIDFSSPVTKYSSVAKPLVIGTLDGMGAHVDDVDNWKVETRGSSIVLSGKLTRGGLRQMLSPMLRPAAMVEEEESPGTEAMKDPKVIASQRYYRSVNKLLTELQDQKAKTLTRIAYFMTKYADSMDELPLLNVDPELVKFGQGTSKILRIMSGVATGTESSSKLTQALTTEGWSTYSGYGVGYGGAYGYGYGYVPGGAYYSNNYGAVASSVAQGQQSELQTRVDGFKKINEAKNDVRQKMVQKYGVEF
jgi:hypothetical protein